MAMYEISDEKVETICRRVDDLAHLNRELRDDRAKIRNLMDGGLRGMATLLGKNPEKVTEDQLPVANMLLMANVRLAQKLGRKPDVKVDPPATHDSDRANRHAGKRQRILESWDKHAKVKMQLPQLGRWLPGYGIAVWTVSQKFHHGDPYPHASIRDPYNCYPGNFGVDQSPKDIAFAYRMTVEQLKRKYPEHATKLEHMKNGVGGGMHANLDTSRASTYAGMDSNRPGWSSQSGEGVDIYEYINGDGTWWVVPAANLLLEHIPNPLESGPPFVFRSRFAFNMLRGQYDHAVGLLAGLARLNTLAVIAAEQSVFAETNVIGDVVGGNYQKGQGAINKLRQGSQVQKQNDAVPFQVFQQIERMEQQLRAQSSYPISEDGRSPMSFVTGRGMDSLGGSIDLEVREYQTILEDGLEELDAKRFEWAERLYSNRTLKITGMSQGSPFAETYIPATHIAGHWNSRRVYGIMAGWDEPNKIIGGTNLLNSEILDHDTFRENIDGLENHEKIKERIRTRKIENGLFAGLGARAEQGDVLTIQAMIKMLPDGDMKKLLTEVYLKPLEEQQAGQADPMGMAVEEGAMEGPPPDVQTLLNQMTNRNEPVMGLQSVGRVGA